MAPLGLLPLLVLLVSIASAASASPLLVVGDVTATTARVLVDAPRNSGGDATATVFVRSATTAQASAPSTADYTVDREIQLALSPPVDTNTERPQVLALDGLSPGRDYAVTFHFAQEETVRFRTSNDQGAKTGQPSQPSTRVLVVSCDRFVNDGDDALWDAITRDLDAHEDSYFGVAHIGDQVYVDAGDARVPVRPVSEELMSDREKLRARYELIVQQFRAIYRATLGRPAAQRVLRRGAHWMLPDDHEIINNLNSYSVDRAFGRGESVLDKAERRGLQLHYRAGLQVMYEYQYQLQRDVAWEKVDFFEDPLKEVLASHPLYFSVEIDRLKLFFLDVRFDRSFTLSSPDERQLLISPTQRDALERQLQSWTSEPSQAPSIVVLSSMPLFFHSGFTANIVYAVEKELYPGHPEHARGLEELFGTFQAFLQPPSPALKLLVGGDVHTLAHTQVCGSSGKTVCIDQLITSGLTNGSTAIHDVKLVPFYLLILRLYPIYDWLMSSIGMPPAPWTLNTDRTFLGRNYGVLEVNAQGDFEWRNSVVLDHQRLGGRLTQVAFDLVLPLLASAVLLLVLRLLLRSPRQKTKTE